MPLRGSSVKPDPKDSQDFGISVHRPHHGEEGRPKAELGFGFLVCCSLSPRFGETCLFSPHFPDEVRQGGLSTDLIQTGPNSRFPRNGESVAMSSLTICLAGNARPFFGDAAGTFIALFGLNWLTSVLNCPCFRAQHPAVNVVMMIGLPT